MSFQMLKLKFTPVKFYHRKKNMAKVVVQFHKRHVVNVFLAKKPSKNVLGFFYL